MATPEQDDWIYQVGGVHPSRFADRTKGALAEAWDWTKQKAADAGHAVGEFDKAHGHVLTRAAGAAQMVGGAAEALAGGSLAGVGGVATGTGVGAAPGIPAVVGGAALAVNGADNAQAGLRTLLTGEFHHTAISEAAGAGAKALGASDATAERITNGVDFVQGVAGGAGAAVAGAARKGAATGLKVSTTMGRAGHAAEEGEEAAKLAAGGPHAPPVPPSAVPKAASSASSEAAAIVRRAAITEAKKKYGLRADLGEQWFDEQGKIRWPANAGAAGAWTTKLLKKGDLIDRYGPKSGKYFSPAGTPFGARALPSDPGQITHTVYRILRDFEVKASEIAPCFDQPGGGIQYLTERAAQDLTAATPEGAFLEEVR